MLAYVADLDDDGLDELRTVASAGGPSRKLVELEYIPEYEWQPGPAPPRAFAAAPVAARGAPARLVRTVSTSFRDGRARLADVRLLGRFSDYGDRPLLSDLSRDGRLVALFRDRRELRVRDLRTNRERLVARVRTPQAEPVALFSPDGRLLLYRRWARLLVYDLRSRRSVPVAHSPWGLFSWTREGKIVYSDRGRLMLVRPGAEPRRLPGAPSSVAAFALSPDGRKLLYDWRCETFLLDLASGRRRRLSGHLFVVRRAWAPNGSYFVLQWAEDCTPSTGGVWAYHSHDVLFSRAGERVATLGGRQATWSHDGRRLLVYPHPTGSAVSGLEGLVAVDPRRRTESTLLDDGNAYSEAFVGPGDWIVFARYDNPSRVSYEETSGGLYAARIVGR
jgi:hypothetical protein